MKKIKVRTASPEETLEFGRKLAQELKRGSVVGLVGDLGTGKTCLIQGICQGLGVSDPVTSPSFVIISEYLGQTCPVYHFDLYRLADPSELLELGYEEYFYGDGICLVEWAERAGGLLPEDSVEIHLRWIGDEVREITVTDKGHSYYADG